MGKKSIETQFKDFLVENLQSLDYNLGTVKRQTGEHKPHIRMRHSSIPNIGIITSFLDSKNIKYKFDNSYTRTPDYFGNGITVDWNGHKVGFLLALHKKGGVKRKDYTPDNLNLSGKSYSSSFDLKKDVLESLTQDSNYDFLKSLLEHLEGSSNNIKIERYSAADINRISSDFGEILCGYYKLLRGYSIEFPLGSNNPIADIIVDGNIPISVKGHNAGKKVSLSAYKKLIPTDTDTGRFLKSIATHNRDDFFKYAARLCPAVREVANTVGGTSKKSVEKYVKKVSYSDFYSYISNTEVFKGYGIPSGGRGTKPSDLWARGSLDPFYFTVNTLIDRLWGRVETDNISSIMKNINSSLVFMDISIKGSGVTIKEQSFESSRKWETIYWSSATAAFRNWIGIITR